ncbi:TPA: hypothetical protein ACN311_002453 [Vibrio parahaemolyticus]
MKNNTAKMIPLFLIFFSIVFKDLFNIAGFFIGIELVVLYYMVPLIMSVFYVLLNISDFKSNECYVFYIVSAFINLLIFLFNNAWLDNYSFYQITLIIYSQFVIAIIIATLSMFAYEVAFRALIYTWCTTFIIVIISFIVHVVFIYFNPEVIKLFYLKLYEAHLVVNPFQSSSSGLDIRFSSIFSSSLSLGYFCAISVIFLTMFRMKWLTRVLLIVLIGFMVYFSFNRNSYFLFLFSVTASLLYLFRFNVFNLLPRAVFFLVVVFSLFLPFLILNYYDLGYGTYILDGGSVTKLSTLFSRFDSWYMLFYDLDLDKFIFGSGVVQGIGDTQEYIDNGIYYMFFQSGFFSVVFYLFVIYLFMIKSAMEKSTEATISALCLSVGLLASLLNNIFYDSIFIVFSILVFSSYLKGVKSNGS